MISTRNQHYDKADLSYWNKYDAATEEWTALVTAGGFALQARMSSFHLLHINGSAHSCWRGFASPAAVWSATFVPLMYFNSIRAENPHAPHLFQSKLDI